MYSLLHVTVYVQYNMIQIQLNATKQFLLYSRLPIWSYLIEDTINKYTSVGTI